MKIDNKPDNFLETNIENVQSKDFGIGDSSIIIEILRNKLYQHKIGTLVQEYLCNARDAHREIGQTKRIQVSEPNALFPFFKVRDFGPGISPSRINDVFVYYGRSTKRLDNHQTGGFGIGAKSAWAYTDSFTITTYINGIQRTYIAHTGTNKEGRLDFISEVQTLEDNGTEINIACEPKDYQEFVNAIQRTVYFWKEDELPEKHSIKYTKDLIYSQKYFSLLNHVPHLRTSTYVILVVDGIMYEYPSFKYNLYSDTHIKVPHIVFHLNTGDVEVNANRESIVLNDTNKTQVDSLIEKSLSDFKEYIQIESDKISSLDEYIKFYSKYSKIVRLNLTKTLDNIKLNNSYIQLEQKIEQHTYKIRKSYRYDAINRYQIDIWTDSVDGIPIGDLSNFVYEDCENVNRASLKRRLLNHLDVNLKKEIYSIPATPETIKLKSFITHNLSEILPKDDKVKNPRKVNRIKVVCHNNAYGSSRKDTLTIGPSLNIKYFLYSFYESIRDRIYSSDIYLYIGTYYVLKDEDESKIKDTLCVNAQSLLNTFQVSQDKIYAHIYSICTDYHFRDYLDVIYQLTETKEPLFKWVKDTFSNVYYDTPLTNLEKLTLSFQKEHKKAIKNIIKLQHKVNSQYPLLKYLKSNLKNDIKALSEIIKYVNTQKEGELNVKSQLSSTKK